MITFCELATVQRYAALKMFVTLETWAVYRDDEAARELARRRRLLRAYIAGVSSAEYEPWMIKSTVDLTPYVRPGTVAL